MAVASSATAAGLAVLLAGAAFGLQAVALPRPTSGQLIAAKTLRWFTRHDAVESTALVRGRPVSSVCVNATVGSGRGDSKQLRASLLLTGARRLLETRLASFRLGFKPQEEDGPRPAIRALLAGCPRVLERWIGRFLDDRLPVHAQRFIRRGVPMLRLSFTGPHRTLFLIVEPGMFVPVAVRVAGAGSGWADLAPAERPDLVEGFRLPRRLRPIIRLDL
jgi:hypothetical protein